MQQEIIDAQIQGPDGRIEKVTLLRVGWQQSYIDPDYGPSGWQLCDEELASILHGRYDYRLRAVYALASPLDEAGLLENTTGEEPC
ncbi:MAG: hypothetical protein A2286_02695 [Gammaproteobacteria bacterium RIFOXYA12_FULL_61_12]|nr:MAG: hypothetical protein A2286_02695 [Gammaproteobacteria bacterium RIFOXYA12_FULL_61_12]OGT89748.1 MAG: hypothetical protein A2514_10350 [Gammaproteobacteria bacterium RIFOXYD12_FULL_61_37]